MHVIGKLANTMLHVRSRRSRRLPRGYEPVPRASEPVPKADEPVPRGYQPVPASLSQCPAPISAIQSKHGCSSRDG